MKLTATRYNAEALMPDWMFTNQLQITESHRQQVLNAELNSDKAIRKWGWDRKGLQYNQDTMKLAKIVGSQFVDIMLNHFDCQQNGRYVILPNGVATDVEFTFMCSYGIKPDHDRYLGTEPAFYRALCWLDCDENSHKVEIIPTRPLNNPHLAFPVSTVVTPEQLKIIFVPGLYHVNFHGCESDCDTVFYQANVMVKRVS